MYANANETAGHTTHTWRTDFIRLQSKPKNSTARENAIFSFVQTCTCETREIFLQFLVPAFKTTPLNTNPVVSSCPLQLPPPHMISSPIVFTPFSAWCFHLNPGLFERLFPIRSPFITRLIRDSRLRPKRSAHVFFGVFYRSLKSHFGVHNCVIFSTIGRYIFLRSFISTSLVYSKAFKH